MSNASMGGGQKEFRQEAARAVAGLSLLILVVVVALRPLISESYDSAGIFVSRAFDDLLDPTPARTLGLDLAILVAACGWLLARALSREIRYRLTGLEAGAALLVIAGVVSTWFAGNKRVALNATVDWLCLPVMCMVLVQLLRKPSHKSLLLAAILASACVQAAACYEQYFIGFAETIEQYEAHREEFWALQGVNVDSSTVEAFERRLRSGEASGLFAHSNVAGAYLLLCVFASATILVTSLSVKRSDTAARAASSRVLKTPAVFASGVLCAAMAGAVLLTGSTAALIAGMAGLVILAAALWKADWIRSHRRLVVVVVWAGAALSAAAVIAHGLYHDSLPGWSLTFRWQYWKASGAMVADHLWTGVGRENFGRHYTAYKDISSPEAVSNPHNLLVQAAAEWGLPGLLAILGMMAGVSWLLVTRRANAPARETGEKTTLSWLTAVGLMVIAGKVALLGSDDWNYIYYSAVTTGLVWVACGLVFATAGGGQLAATRRFPMAVGLLAFLLQDMVNFALYVPASATTFFAVLALVMAPQWTESEARQGPSGRRWMLLGLGLVGLAAFTIWIFGPVFRSNRTLQRARQFERHNATAETIERTYMKAAVLDPLDPTPWAELARWQAGGRATASLRQSVQSLNEAIRRDPHNVALRRHLSSVYSEIARQTGEKEAFMEAIEAAKAALQLYPQVPAGLSTLADRELAAGEKLTDPQLLRDSIGHYQGALDLDGRRLHWETLQRFRPREVEEIEMNMARARQLLE